MLNVNKLDAITIVLARGERHGMTKFNEQDIREMRALHAAGGMTTVEIAKRFNSHPTTIQKIINRINWSHVE